MSVAPPTASRAEHDPASMEHAVKRLRSAIAARLTRAGVPLADDALAPLADAILDDAVRIALAWLERG